MSEQMRTIGYLCPKCGKTVMAARSVFALEASNAEVSCDCGGSALQVEYDGNVFYDEFIYGMITNSKSVGGFKGIIPGDIGLNDGVFEVTLIKTPKNPIQLNEILAFLTGIVKDSNMVYSFQTADVKFTASEEIAWTLDGEFGGDHSVAQVTNRHQALEIIVE